MLEINPTLKISAYRTVLLVMALMVVFVLAGRATTDTQLATSVMASAGGEAASTNFKMKYTLDQSTPIGPASSANFQVGAGFWYQDPVAPSAIGDLAIALADSDIVLQWSHAGDNVAIDHYAVYRATDPGFEPAGGACISETKGTSYRDFGAAKDTVSNYFYVVKATDPRGNLAEDSNRVGEFDKNVMTGQ